MTGWPRVASPASSAISAWPGGQRDQPATGPLRPSAWCRAGRDCRQRAMRVSSSVRVVVVEGEILGARGPPGLGGWCALGYRRSCPGRLPGGFVVGPQAGCPGDGLIDDGQGSPAGEVLSPAQGLAELLAAGRVLFRAPPEQGGPLSSRVARASPIARISPASTSSLPRPPGRISVRPDRCPGPV